MYNKIITQVSDWLIYKREIEELLSTSTLVTPHSTTSWLTSWWKAYGKRHELRVGLFWNGDQLVGYAPLMISHKRMLGFPYWLLHFIGEGLSDYADIFCLHDDLSIKEEIIQIILTEWEWDSLFLINVRHDSNTIEVIKNKTDGYFSAIQVNTRCLFIRLADQTFGDYYKSLSRNHRRELQKRKNKLDVLKIWSVQFNPPNNPEDLFYMFGNLHTKRAIDKRWQPLYKDPDFRLFFFELFNTPQPDFEILYSTLHHQDKLISYTFGFVTNNIYYHWNIGFLSEYSEISPNKIHHQFLIEECFKRGYKEFDFMRGDSDYKFKWTKLFRNNYKILVMKKGKLQTIYCCKTWLSKITQKPRSFIQK